MSKKIYKTKSAAKKVATTGRYPYKVKGGWSLSKAPAKSKKTKPKKKPKSQLRAKDFKDRTPQDYEDDKKRVRQLAKDSIKKIDVLKKRSIKLDLKKRHKQEPWEKKRK